MRQSIIVLFVLVFSFCLIDKVNAKYVEKSGMTVRFSCEGNGMYSDASPITVTIRSYPFGHYASCSSSKYSAPCELNNTKIQNTDEKSIEKFASSAAFRPGGTKDAVDSWIYAYTEEMKLSSEEFFLWIQNKIGLQITIENYDEILNQLNNKTGKVYSFSFQYVEKNNKIIIEPYGESAMLPFGKCTIYTVFLETFMIEEPDDPITPGKENDRYSDVETCTDVDVNHIKACGCIPAEVADITSKVYFILRLIGPILLLIIGGFEMAKAVATQDESSIEKAKKKLVNKFIAAAAIFLVLTIIKLAVSLVAENTPGTFECVNILLDGYVI